MKQIKFSDKRKFFYDCEFMEEPGFIQLISIGMVGDNEEEFYACNLDANFKKADQWVKDNVIPQLPSKGKIPKTGYMYGPWMTEEEIKVALLGFMNPSEDNPVELWGYYADYDHVLLSWLFGKMIDLPKGMPKYTLDIKQLIYHMNDVDVPKQRGPEHCAIDDAKYCKTLYDHLVRIEKFDIQ